MGPVRRYPEHEADFRSRQARYALKWFVVMLTTAALFLPAAVLGWVPAPVVIVVVIALMFGLGMSSLAMLGAVLHGWQARRTPSMLEQRVLRVIGAVLGALLLLGVELVFLFELYRALQTHEITVHHRSAPSTTYALQTDPSGFLLAFGFEAAIALSIPAVLLYVWREKRKLVAPGSLRPGR